MSKIYDAVVIGGGAIGSACAYYLSKEGLKVALVEKKDFSDGTSSKCDGHLCAHDSEAGFFSQISKRSLDLYADEISKDLNLDIQYDNMGIGMLCETEQEVALMKEIIIGKKKEGISVSFVNQYELQQQEPYLAKDVLGAAVYDCDCKLNPMFLCYALAAKAKSMGTDLYQYRTVTDIKTNDKGRVEKVITDKEELLTENVINACGVWSGEIGRMVGLQIPVTPRQGEILITEKTPIKVASRSYSEVGYMAVKKGIGRQSTSQEMEEYGVAFVIEGTANNNFLLGSSRIFAGHDDSVKIGIIKLIAQRAMRFFPILKDINIIRTYGGLRPSTPDGYPIISATNIPGFYIATGHEGNGISLAPFTGKTIMQLVTQREPNLDISRLNLDRFNK